MFWKGNLRAYTGDLNIHRKNDLDEYYASFLTNAPVQVNSVIENLSITCLLLKFSSLPELENKIKVAQFWSTILDMNKAYLVSEKLLAQASESGK